MSNAVVDCRDSVNAYMALYRNALASYKSQVAAHEATKPNDDITSYPEKYTKQLDGLCIDRAVQDALQQECAKIPGYKFADVIWGSGTGGWKCTGTCTTSNESIQAELLEWNKTVPRFNPPQVKELICQNCQQDATNVLSLGKGVKTDGLVQSSLLRCVTNLANATQQVQTHETTSGAPPPVKPVRLVEVPKELMQPPTPTRTFWSPRFFIGSTGVLCFFCVIFMLVVSFTKQERVPFFYQT